MAFHFAVRAQPGCVLFRTHAEARALWDRLVAAFPTLIALCLMPDHVHLVLSDADSEGRLAAVLSGYARWRNHVRGERGRVFADHGPPEEVPDGDHLRRTVRYVHLNAPRKGLVTDPLEWPWSTHRDAVGLAFPAVVERRRNVAQFHRYVSSDPTVNVVGTELPSLLFQDFALDDVISAVAGVCRIERWGFVQDRTAQRLAVQVAWHRGFKDLGEVSAAVGCGRSTAWRWMQGLEPGLTRIEDPALRACVHTVGDPRIGALPPGDLRPRWAPYRRHQ